MLENRMVAGEEYPSYLHSEKVFCNEKTFLGLSLISQKPVYAHCQERAVEGLTKCKGHGLEECGELWEMAAADALNGNEWTPAEIAGLADEEAAYREAAAR